VNAEPVLLRVLDTPQAFTFSSESDWIAIAGCRGSVPEHYSYNERPCAVSETHVWHLHALDIARGPARMIDNGQANIVQLQISPTPFWNAPLIAALRDYGVLQLTSGGRSWTLDLGSVEQFAFSPDGAQLVVSSRRQSGSSSYGDTFSVLDLETYATYGIRNSPSFNIPNGLDLIHMVFADDGQRLLGTVPNGIWYWDVDQPDAEPVFEQRLPIPEEADPDAVRLLISPDLRHVFTYEGGEGRLWIDAEFLFTPGPPATSYIPIPWERHEYRSFSPGGRYLILGREASDLNEDGIYTGEPFPGQIRLYDSASGTLALTLAPAAMLSKTVFSADETKIAYPDHEHRVHLFAIDEAREIGVLNGFAAETYGVAVHPDGRIIYSTCAIRLPTANTSACMLPTFFMGEQSLTETGFATQAVSPDGRLLVNRQLTFRDSTTGEIIREIEPRSSRVWHLDFSPDGDWMAVSGETPHLLSLEDPSAEPIWLEIPINEFGTVPWTPAIVYSPDGQLVATASYDGTARLWDAHSGELLATLHSETSARSEALLPSGDGIAFSPDGTLLAFGTCYLGDGSAASACWHQHVYVYNVSTALEHGALQPTDAQVVLAGAQDYTVGLVFSPDGSLIVGSGSPAGWETDAGHEINVWSVQTGELLTVLQAAGATEIAFSPDGRQLYSNSVAGVVYRWGVMRE
jgi:WD40 repeat protein